MLTPEITETIIKVARRLSNKYKFGYYEATDIEQEAIIIAIEVLPKYKPESGPLENFLHVHLKRRLQNLKRDKYYRMPQKACSECGLFSNKECPKCEARDQRALSKCQLNKSADPSNFSENEYFSSLLHGIELEEIRHLIDEKLPMEYRTDYLKMLDEVYIPKARKEEIKNIILDILKDYHD